MKRTDAGFTLVELLVVIAILGIVLGIGVSSLTATFRTTNKTTVFNQVKQNGDFTLETMTRTVRNAIDVCTPSATDIRMYSAKVDCAGIIPSNLEVTRFQCTLGGAGSNGMIERFDNGSGISTQLVSSVKVSACSFAVNTTIPKRVTIDFTLDQDYHSVTPDLTISIPFHTEITLRNF